MTEQADQPTPDTAAEPDQPATPPDDGQDSNTPPRSSKDARNRVELRETKARLERMQRREIERLLADRMADPADFWVSGATVDALLDEHGDIDDTKVTTAVDGLLEQRPHWAAPKPEPHKRQRGLTSGVGRPRPTPSNWAAALRGDGV